MRISIPEKTIHIFSLRILFLLWPLITFTNYSLALTPSPTPAVWDSRLCPENSECTQAAANLYQKWEALETAPQKFKQLKTFFKQHGLWVDLWRATSAPTASGALYWDSECRQHQGKFLKSALPLKNSTDLPTGHHLEPLLLLDPQGKITTYAVPIGDRPLRLEQGRLEFIRSIKNYYYRLQISPQQIWQIQPMPTVVPPSELGAEIPCPPSLSAHFTQLASPIGLYQNHFCRQLNTGKDPKRRPSILLIPWSCAL